MKTSYIAIVLAAALALATVYFTTMKDTVAPETTPPTTQSDPEGTTPTVPEAVQGVAQPECTQYSLSDGAWVCTQTAATGN